MRVDTERFSLPEGMYISEQAVTLLGFFHHERISYRYKLAADVSQLFYETSKARYQ